MTGPGQFRNGKYGEAGKKIRFAEAFQVCEYGTVPTKEELDEMFPF